MTKKLKKKKKENKQQQKDQQQELVEVPANPACQARLLGSISRWLISFQGDLLCFVFLLTLYLPPKGTTVQSVNRVVVLLPNICKGPLLRKNEFTFKEHLLL